MANILATKSLDVQADGAEIPQQVTLTIPVGEVHALLEPKGRGKTALVITIMVIPI